MTIIRFLKKRILQRKIFKLEVQIAKYLAIAKVEKQKALEFQSLIESHKRKAENGDGLALSFLRVRLSDWLESSSIALANYAESQQLVENLNNQLATLYQKFNNL